MLITKANTATTIPSPPPPPSLFDQFEIDPNLSGSFSALAFNKFLSIALI